MLEKRMEQSKAMIFVVSENSRNSVWCKYELKYDLISCAKEWRANKKSFQSALDYIYLSKDIIIKQDVLIS